MKIKTIDYFSLIFFSICLIHIIYSFFIGDAYNFTRIISTTLLSIVIFLILIRKLDYAYYSIKSQKTLFLFLFLPIIQYFFSPYINTTAEKTQQLLISFNYIFIAFLSTFFFYTLKKISIKNFFFYTILINILIITSLILYYILFIDIIDFNFTIKRFFTNIRFINHLQTIFIPILLFFYSLCKIKIYKILTLLLIVINFIILFYTEGRGTLYAIFFSSIIIFIISKKNIRKNLFVLFLTFLVSLILYIIFDSLLNNSISELTHLKSFSGSGRIEIYTMLIKYLFNLNYFITSIGFASQDIALYGFLHPHNLFLYIFLGSGGIAVIIFIYILLKYILKVWSYIQTNRTKVSIYFIYIFLSFLIHSIVSGLYITPLSQIFFLYFFTYLNIVVFKPKIINSKSNNKFLLLLFFCIMVFILIINIIYTKKAYDFTIYYQYTKNEIKNNNDNLILNPGFLLFHHKIIEKR